MSDMIDEPTPDINELLQDEVPQMSVVPVKIEEAAGFWQLPNRRVRTASELVDSVTWVRILDNSKKRARATLMAFTNPVRIRVSTSGTGAQWPAGVAYNVFHTQELWMLCATGGQTSEISITEEFWSD